MESLPVVPILITITFGLLGVLLVWYQIQREKKNPPIEYRNGKIEYVGFIKNTLIDPGQIDQISMVYISDEDDVPHDVISFQFKLANGKIRTLHKPSKGLFKSGPYLTVPEIQLLQTNYPKMKLDAFTENYLEVGSPENFVAVHK